MIRAVDNAAAEIDSSKSGIHDLLRSLEEEFHIFLKPVSRAIAILANSSWHSVHDLVDASGLPHRTMVETAQICAPWLECKHDTFRIKDLYRAPLLESLAEILSPVYKNQFGGELDHSVKTHLPLIRQVIADAPGYNYDLDHVSATPETCARRVQFLASEFYLKNQAVLFFGDHDLTSIALSLLIPTTRVAVVDVDEEILTYINHVAKQHRLEIETYFADARLGLPASLHSQFPLAVTDPPYTPAGMRLFLSRCVEALRADPWSRILASYGYSVLNPLLGLQVQREIEALNLVYQSVLPGFNQYDRAEAIGKASALYVFQPTRLSRPAATNPPEAVNIYTHGIAASEAADAKNLETPVRTFFEKFAHGGDEVVVGTELKKGILPNAQQLSLRKFFQSLVLPSGKPPFTKSLFFNSSVVVSLAPSFPAELAARVLLLSDAAALGLIVRSKDVSRVKSFDEDPKLRALLSVRYGLAGARRWKDNVLVVFSRRISEPASVLDTALWEIATKSHALLVNSWREGLIKAVSAYERSLTKNEARKLICDTRSGRLYSHAFTSELSLDALRDLVDDVALTTGVCRNAGRPLLT